MKYLSRWITLIVAAGVLAGAVFYIGQNLQSGPGMGPPGGGPMQAGPGMGPPGGGPMQAGPGMGPPGGGPGADVAQGRIQGGPPTGNQDLVQGESIPAGTLPAAPGPTNPVVPAGARTTVSVVTRATAAYHPTLNAYGQAEAHYSLTLAAQVAGQVDEIGPRFEDGLRVARGEWLVKLEDSDYRAALSDAEYALETARLELLEAEREAEQARAEWEAAGLEGEPDSPLVLHEPQVAAAKAAVTKNVTAVESARKDLKQTRITAPMEALVVERLVAPGSYVQAGSNIATLYSTDRVEITVALSARDWRNLPEDQILSKGNWPATLTSIEDGRQWSGRVLRAAQHLDDSTRQRSLIIAVDRPLDQSPALLPGNFVQVSIRGRRVEGLWQLPSSALSQRNEIWYVSADQTLDKFATNPVFADANGIYITPPAELATQPQRILVQPLSSYVKGTPVTARLVDSVEVAHNE